MDVRSFHDRENLLGSADTGSAGVRAKPFGAAPSSARRKALGALSGNAGGGLGSASAKKSGLQPRRALGDITNGSGNGDKGVRKQILFGTPKATSSAHSARAIPEGDLEIESMHGAYGPRGEGMDYTLEVDVEQTDYKSLFTAKGAGLGDLIFDDEAQDTGGDQFSYGEGFDVPGDFIVPSDDFLERDTLP